MIPDVNPLGATFPTGEKADAKTIAAKMQGMFLETMLKTMEDSIEAEDGLFGKSASSEIYRGMLREQLSAAMSAQLPHGRYPVLHETVASGNSWLKSAASSILF